MIIGLSGHIKSGKSTAAALIKKHDNSFVEKYFAYKLKYIAAYLTGEDIKNFETQEGKDGYLEEWGMTRREFLQKLGTESLRNTFHNNIWIKALFADYKISEYFEILPNWIISDVRFQNEANEIKNRGGKIIRINRPFALIYPQEWNGYLGATKSPTEPDFIEWLKPVDFELFKKLSHGSEIELDNYQDFDFTIENNSDVENFHRQLFTFLTNLNLS